ncbi:MAG: biopolymer transporter ExbD [Planctomycetes bacterium]|nr:biopolymer transporter ExbD [Planctomycetota bacterium]
MAPQPAPLADDVDLNPLIDVITLLVVFFLLAGRINTTARPDAITVPPGRTATTPPPGERLVVNLAGAGDDLRFAIGSRTWSGTSAPSGLRGFLDQVWERAPRRDGAADVVLEIRADGDVSYRAVQETMQLAADSLDPAGMVPKASAQRPFHAIAFTTRSTQEQP